jgi:hypothetical protein
MQLESPEVATSNGTSCELSHQCNLSRIKLHLWWVKLQLVPEEVAKQAGSTCIFSWNNLHLQKAKAHLQSTQFALMTAEVETCPG